MPRGGARLPQRILGARRAREDADAVPIRAGGDDARAQGHSEPRRHGQGLEQRLHVVGRKLLEARAAQLEHEHLALGIGPGAGHQNPDAHARIAAHKILWREPRQIRDLHRALGPPGLRPHPVHRRARLGVGCLARPCGHAQGRQQQFAPAVHRVERRRIEAEPLVLGQRVGVGDGLHALDACVRQDQGTAERREAVHRLQIDRLPDRSARAHLGLGTGAGDDALDQCVVGREVGVDARLCLDLGEQHRLALEGVTGCRGLYGQQQSHTELLLRRGRLALREHVLGDGRVGGFGELALDQRVGQIVGERGHVVLAIAVPPLQEADVLHVGSPCKHCTVGAAWVRPSGSAVPSHTLQHGNRLGVTRTEVVFGQQPDEREIALEGADARAAGRVGVGAVLADGHRQVQ